VSGIAPPDVSAVSRAPRRPRENAVHRIAMQVRRAMTSPRGEAFGDHPHDGEILLARQRRVGMRADEGAVQRFLVPFARRHFGDDLLGKHVEGLRRNRNAVELTAPHGIEERRALDQLVARQREKPRLRLTSHRVVGTACALQERGNRAWRAELADELDVADVDAELERRRGDQRAAAHRFSTAARRRNAAPSRGCRDAQ
jgi:hypothetical protein